MSFEYWFLWTHHSKIPKFHFSSLNGIVHFKIKRALFTEKSPGNQQKNGFINKHREIVPIKNMVSNAASDNTRNCKKYQNSQFSTDAHPFFLLQDSHLS